MKHRPKHIVEYLAVRAVAGLIQYLPYRVALGLGWGRSEEHTSELQSPLCI